MRFFFAHPLCVVIYSNLSLSFADRVKKEGGKLKLNSAHFQVKFSAGAELGKDGSEHMCTTRLLTD